MDKLFPVFLNLKGKKVLIVGLGEVAMRKAQALHNAGAEVIAIGLELKIPELAKIANVQVRSYQESDIKDIFIAVAATDDKKFNTDLCAKWDQYNIISNNATERTTQNAYFVYNEIIDGCHVAISGLGYPARARQLLKKQKRIYETSGYFSPLWIKNDLYRRCFI